MDARTHLLEEKRLDQALNRNLDSIENEIAQILIRYNIDSMPGIAFDVCKHTIEKLYLSRLNLPEY